MTILLRVIASFIDSARKVAKASGKSFIYQLIEAIRFKLGKQKIGLSEYHDCGIWDPVLSNNQRHEFIGWRTSGLLDQKLNHSHSRILANDKLINYLILASHGFPIPKPIATYTHEKRSIANERILGSKEELLQFLDEDIFPCFVKPISAGCGNGAMGIARIEAPKVLLLNGRAVGIETFLTSFDTPAFKGMLFQECIATHPKIRELTGSNSVSCVRMICIVTQPKPIIHTAFFKIVTGNNMLDNFSRGVYGNCLAMIDPDTGVLTHAIARLGPGGAISHHPTTQRPLIGFKLPDWDSAIELVMRATRHFPGLGLQNWDVALTPDGPILVELNTESELDIPQAINHKGMMDHRMHKILKSMTD